MPVKMRKKEFFAAKIIFMSAKVAALHVRTFLLCGGCHFLKLTNLQNSYSLPRGTEYCEAFLELKEGDNK